MKTPAAWFVAVVVATLSVLPMAAFAQTSQASQPSDRFSAEPLTNPREAAAGTSSNAGPSASRVVVSLCVVAVLIVGLGWAYKRMFAAQQHKAGGAVSLVSRTMLTPKHQVFVLRVGHRLIVVGDSGHGMNRLGEITDAAEMTAVLGEAGGAEMQKLRGGAFAATLEDFDRRPLPGGDGEAAEETPPFDDARDEVQSLIARVRGLAGQVGGESRS